MVYKLSCFSSCCCESHSEYDIVESAFEHDEEVLTGSAFSLRCLLEQVAELSLAESVSESYLLLLGQLDTVFALFAASYSAMSLRLLIYTKVLRLDAEGSSSLQYRSSIS